MYALLHVLLLVATVVPASPVRPAGTCGAMPARPDSLSGLVVDDADERRVEVTAYWKVLPARAVGGAYGPTVLSDEGTGADGVVRFYPDLETDGAYAVDLYWPAPREGREVATNASVTVRHEGGLQAFTVDQRRHAQQWYTLGTFVLAPGRRSYVEIRNDAADGIVLADAVRFTPCP